MFTVFFFSFFYIINEKPCRKKILTIKSIFTKTKWCQFVACSGYRLYYLPCVTEAEICIQGCAAFTLDGVLLLCSLLVDSITSPYIDDSGERIYSKFDQWDYKPLRTRSFKPHLCCLEGPQYITPSVQWIHQSPFAPLLHVFWDQIKGKDAERTGIPSCRGQQYVNWLLQWSTAMWQSTVGTIRKSFAPVLT